MENKQFYFTYHAKQKFKLVKKAGFPLTRQQVKNTINNPNKIEDRSDGTFIASKILDSTYIIRVVYRIENDIIVVITFYPAKRKAYEI